MDVRWQEERRRMSRISKGGVDVCRSADDAWPLRPGLVGCRHHRGVAEPNGCTRNKVYSPWVVAESDSRMQSFQASKAADSVTAAACSDFGANSGFWLW